ncbi:MAG TPA: hypothetical protein VHN99_08775 [Deinococcales bacterium]|nr:hypothetical protein [Deinococcales bacterium]
MRKWIAAPVALFALTAAMVAAQPQSVTLKVVGFKVAAAETGTPLDKAYQAFVTSAQKAIPGLKLDLLDAPPDDAQLLVDLAAGTAPDVWSQDASSLARLVSSGNTMDIRKCLTVDPKLNLNRFYPSVLKIHQAPDGSITSLPNDFTPMVVYYNPEVFAKSKVAAPSNNWTWAQFLKTAQLLTLDNKGRNRLDPNFDEKNVVQWGYRMRNYTYAWIFRTWENGGDVISPDGTTATGYLDSPATMQALQWMADLVLKYKVSPKPSVYTQMTQAGPFDNLFLQGKVAMFDSGHWELVGLLSSPDYKAGRVAVVPQPRQKNGATVLYESSFVINKSVEKDPAKMKAACQLVDRATDTAYQNTKVLTGIAVAANQFSAAAAIKNSKLPEVDRTFLNAVAAGRPPYGSKFANYPAVETILDSMMDRILNGTSVADAVKSATTEINRELSKK